MEDRALKEKIKDIHEKVSRGLTLSMERLIEATAKDDGELIFSRDGKIIRVNARKLLAERKRAKGSEQAQHE